MINGGDDEDVWLKNRLNSLYWVKIVGGPTNSKTSRNDVSSGGLSILSYSGGPNAPLGIGRTRISYAKDNVGAPLSIRNAVTDNTLSITQLDQVSPILGQIDFRTRLKVQSTLALSYNPANNKTLETRTGLGDPGDMSLKNIIDYEFGYLGVTDSYGAASPNSYDKINALPIYRSQNVDTSQPVNDLVKFRIAVIDNDSPNFKTFMHFRALLGPMSDAYNASWNSVSYLGRGEQFYTYGGFTRTISLSWTVAAQSKAELIPMYKKLNYLASSLTPDYGANGYMKGNLVQLTIGGYLYEQPGFITSLTYEIQEDTPWEIGIGVSPGSEDGTVKEMPHIIRVSGFSFTPIQRFVPSLQDLTFSTNATETTGDDTGPVSSFGDQRFIALANGDTNNDQFSNYNTFDTSK